MQPVPLPEQRLVIKPRFIVILTPVINRNYETIVMLRNVSLLVLYCVHGSEVNAPLDKSHIGAS